MKYTIYKTTNRVNGKIYIGMHKTKNIDDGYMGSGKLLRRAIEKYGVENFEKEILHVFDNEAEMKSKEKELVNEEFLQRSDTYNLCPGGHGGFGYLNSNDLNNQNKNFKEINKKISFSLTEAYKINPLLKERSSRNFKNAHSLGKIRYDTFTGKSHSDETKRKISKVKKENCSSVGDKNSQYGTVWITNGFLNKKIKKLDEMPVGWYLGRIIKK